MSKLTVFNRDNHVFNGHPTKKNGILAIGFSRSSMIGFVRMIENASIPKKTTKHSLTDRLRMWSVSMFYSFLFHRGKYTIGQILVPTISDAFEHQILQLWKATHKLNNGFINQIKSFGATAQLCQYKDENAFLFRTIKDGSHIFWGDTPSYVSQLEKEALQKKVMAFNNKNYFYELMQKADINFNFPVTFIAEQPSVSDLENILYQTDEDILSYLKEYTKADKNKTYFLKLAIGEGGKGIANCTNPFEIRRLIKEAKILTQHGQVSDFQLSEKLTALNSVDTNPLKITKMKSPCMIGGICDNGGFLQQVSEQILKNNTIYIGSYVHVKLEKEFIEIIGAENIQYFYDTLYQDGYRGMHGTDFILTDDNEYYNILDTNGRFNGSHYLQSIRASLVAIGHVFIDGFYGVYHFNPKPLLIEIYNHWVQKLKDYIYQPSSNTGLIVIPIIIENKGELFVSQCRIIFINPSLNPSQWNQFFEIYSNQSI